MTVDQLRDRIATRIETDYDVGHVDIEVTADGEVTYLAVGQRVAGIGPTMPPGNVAVAIRADPSYAASSGDVIQIWRADGSERVCNAELRATAGETLGVVTVGAESALVGAQLGAVTATVIAVAAEGTAAPIQTLPGRDHVLAAGERIYVVATPETLRTVEAAAAARGT